MKQSNRQLTKIARQVGIFTARTLRTDGLGTAEYDFIHAVRKHPGITQAELRELLGLDKGAAARRCAALEAKGYLRRATDPADKRRQLLYATPQAELLKQSKSAVEKLTYDWLFEGLPEADRAEFRRMLDHLYRRMKAESLAGFPQLSARAAAAREAAE